jgi:putative NADH-flavin reductase
MRIVIFGSSGMVGQGALRECLADREVGQVLSVVRAPSGTTHEKLREIVQNNIFNFTPIENDLTGLGIVWRSAESRTSSRGIKTEVSANL